MTSEQGFQPFLPRLIYPKPLILASVKVFADQDYISKTLAQRLSETYDIEFFTKPRHNMTNQLMQLTDKFLACQTRHYRNCH
jgi:hypothetical protein